MTLTTDNPPIDVVTAILEGSGGGNGAPPGKPPKRFPKIILSDYCLICNGIPMHINPKSKMREVLTLFMRSRNNQMTVFELTSKLCQLPPPPKSSHRNFETACHRTVKLVSRSRAMITKRLTHGENSGIEWFRYDNRTKSWKLYDLSRDYFSSKSTFDTETNS